jgi:hypothetical protein
LKARRLFAGLRVLAATLILRICLRVTDTDLMGVCTTAHPISRAQITIPPRSVMLSTLLVVLLVLWLLGIVTSYTLGGFIHILLVVAIVIVLLRVIQGRNPLAG